MKIGIVIIVYNLSSEIFLLQIEAIRKFCKDDFTIEVFDNSDNIEMSTDIKYHAEQLGISYHKTFASSKNSTDSHAFACNTSFQILQDKYKTFFYCDHDLIPVKPFSIKEILNGGHIIAGLGQGGTISYFWAGCVIFRADKIDKSLIDFSPSHKLGLDTGGMLYQVIEKYGKDQCIFFNEAYYQNPNFNGRRSLYAMINDEMFFHFVASSNWDGGERHEERINSLLSLAKEKINAT